MENKKKKCMQGYFSVEASLLFPLILIVQILLVYLSLYCYDRNILEQCAFEAAFRGSSSMIHTNEEAYQVTKEAADYLVEDRVLSMKELSSHVTVSGSEVTVLYEGNLNVPFRRWMADILINRDFSLKVERKMSRIKPVKTIRPLEIGKELLENGSK